MRRSRKFDDLLASMFMIHCVVIVQVGINIHMVTMETMVTPFVRRGQVSRMDQHLQRVM